MRAVTFFALLAFNLGCRTQTTTMNNNQNPLLCDPETGVCAIPVTDPKGNVDIEPVQKPVKIIYYTDPICSSCWGIEPQLRKLKLEYGDYIEVDYRMGGLLPDWSYNSGGISKPADVAHHWDEVSLYYEMPIDGNVWLEDPLDSSYPACIAFKAAQMQDEGKAVAFMRILREKLFLDNQNIAKWKPIALAAIQAGLNAEQLKADCDGPAKTLFDEDLAYGRTLGVRGFPTLFFTDGQNIKTSVYGFKPYDHFEQALLAVHPQARKTAFNNTTPISLFNTYPSLTAKEYAVILNMGISEAKTILENACTNGLLTKQTIKTGVMYRKK